MKLYIPLFDSHIPCEYIFNKQYKTILIYLHNKDYIGLCKYIDELTSKDLNVYEKFILMLSLYGCCVNDKLVFECNGTKCIYYMEDILTQFPKIESEKWIQISDNARVLVKLSNNFFTKIDNNIDIQDMNDYFINNCLYSLEVNGTEHILEKNDIDELPGYITAPVLEYMTSLENKIREIPIFTKLQTTISLFSFLHVIKMCFYTDIHEFNEFEYIARKHARLSNFDDLSYKTTQEMLDLHMREMQEQKSALGDMQNMFNGD